MSTLVVTTVAPAGGTLNVDGALTIGGTSMNETIADAVGGMVTGNTESNITVTYQDADNTLDFALSDSPTFSGTVTAANFNTTSDASVKDGIMTIDGPLNTIANLRGVNFDWKQTGEKSMGVVAQEVEKVLPYLVATDANGLKSVNYQAMVGLLIESVKDLQAQVAKLSK